MNGPERLQTVCDWCGQCDLKPGLILSISGVNLAGMSLVSVPVLKDAGERASGSVVSPELERVLGEAGQGDAQKRAGGCARPVRLVGSSQLVNTCTGETTTTYSSGQELDGVTYIRCGNRRAQVCPSCSAEYKGDAWHLLLCGMAGGKGIPASVGDHPATFATLTAPSFGPVHGVRQRGPCRARREKPVCEHGRPLWCGKRHADDDPRLGTPLCVDCYDYIGHVVWQWHAPELWRRFTIALQRDLARRCGLPVTGFRRRCRIAFSKVVEFQARGLIHLHVPIRLDGPEGPDGPTPDIPIGTADLEDAIRTAAGKVTLVAIPLANGMAYRLRWGNQVDTRTITEASPRDANGRSRLAHPEQVAGYLAKYLTKATEDFGIPTRVLSAAHAATAGASEHAVRIIATAERLAVEHEAYGRLLANLATLGYRGHPITKSRGYSVTFGQLRRVRRRYRRKPAGLDPEADIRDILDPDEDLPDGFERVSTWVFVGQGYLDLDTAAAAVTAAALARTRWGSAFRRWMGNQSRKGKEDGRASAE